MDPKYMIGMKRTTICLPIVLHDDLRQLAFKCHGSMADLLRIAAERYYQTQFAEVRKNKFREERLENISGWRREQEKRRLEKRLAAMNAEAPSGT